MGVAVSIGKGITLHTHTHTQSRNTTMDLKLFLVFMIVAVAVTSARSPYYDDYDYDLYDGPDSRYDRYDEPMRRPPPRRRMQGRYRELDLGALLSKGMELLQTLG